MSTAYIFDKFLSLVHLVWNFFIYIFDTFVFYYLFVDLIFDLFGGRWSFNHFFLYRDLLIGLKIRNFLRCFLYLRLDALALHRLNGFVGLSVQFLTTLGFSLLELRCRLWFMHRRRFVRALWERLRVMIFGFNSSHDLCWRSLFLSFFLNDHRRLNHFSFLFNIFKLFRRGHSCSNGLLLKWVDQVWALIEYLLRLIMINLRVESMILRCLLRGGSFFDGWRNVLCAVGAKLSSLVTSRTVWTWLFIWILSRSRKLIDIKLLDFFLNWLLILVLFDLLWCNDLDIDVRLLFFLGRNILLRCNWWKIPFLQISLRINILFPIVFSRNHTIRFNIFLGIALPMEHLLWIVLVHMLYVFVAFQAQVWVIVSSSGF